MIQLLVNNNPIKLLEEPPKEVFSMTIINIGFGETLVPSELSNPVQEWLYNISQSVINHITYNGSVISKEDVKIPTHMQTKA